MDAKTAAIHGYAANPLFDHVIAPPIQLSTTYVRADDGSYPHGYSYARRSNPNRDALEAILAKLEGGAAAAAFASGTAASMAVFQALATGDHVIVAHDCYYGTREMLQSIFARWGLAFSFVDLTKTAIGPNAGPSPLAAAIQPRTRMIWLETPSNPLLTITDIRAVVALAHAHGLLVAADNTVATPILQQPLALGCDLVVHSTTKYLNGHSDVLGGAVVTREDGDLLARIRTIQVHGGAVPSSFDCWLTQRGLSTVSYRVEAQSASALAIAAFLCQHPRVERVHYPGLTQHPQHALAASQMRHFGGLISFEVAGGMASALAVAARTALIKRATSLGGVESVIEQRSSMEGPGSLTPPGLLRLSVGLEATSDLIGDLDSALRA